MNSEILALQYKKARVFMQNRPRRVTFSLHHRLYRSVHLAEDLKILDREKYRPAGPLESRVWGEKLDQDQLESYMTLVEENFWPMVFSNKWSTYSSIRVTEGALLDSLLVTYYTLVTEGKLLTFTTEIFQKNVNTKPRGKRKRAAEKEEAIKITFTYFSQTADELSQAVEAQQGVSITAAEIRQQNPAFIPKVISDAMQSSLSCSMGTLPDWVKQSSSGEDSECQSKVGDVLLPDNPPNSPTPTQNQVTLKYTHSEMHRRCDQQLGTSVDPAHEYSHLPLVLRTWHNGLASRPVEGITVVGQKLNQAYPPLPPSNGTTDPQVVFLGNRRRTMHQMSTPRIGRNRCTRPVHLPSLSQESEDGNNVIPTGLVDTSRRNSLQMRLLESNHLHDVDICRTAFIPRKVQFINVVSPLVSPLGGEASPTLPTFDTDKLRINSSLEKVRPEVVRQPIRRGDGNPPSNNKGKLPLSGKNYVMQKYLQESISSNDFRNPARLSARSEDQSSYQQSSKLSSENTDMLASNLEFYKQRIPADFIDNCLKATGCFVVRKECVTSSRLYKTVTSLTISKIPERGFQRWKYEN